MTTYQLPFPLLSDDRPRGKTARAFGVTRSQRGLFVVDTNGTIAWSYPIIRNGLIYYVDVANGLYVLRYTGPHADEVAGITFLEGNSNLGDAARLEAELPASVPESPTLWPLLGAGGLVAAIAGVAGARRRAKGKVTN